AVRPRHGAQLSGVEIAPAVIGAGEDARRALVLAAERGAAVGAAVEQRANLSARIPQQDDRAQAQPHRDVVVVLRDLALVPEIDPDRAEDVGHLGLEDRGIGVDQAVDAVLPDKLVPVVEVARDARWFEPVQHGVIPSCRSLTESPMGAKLRSSLPGLTPQVGLARLAALNDAELGQARVPMQSINLRKNLSRRRWMRGSSPRMTGGDAS